MSILSYFHVFGILCVLVVLGYCYFLLSISVQLIAWKDIPEMTYYVSRGTLSICSLTHPVPAWINSGNEDWLAKNRK